MKKTIIAAVLITSMTTQAGWIYYPHTDGEHFAAVGKSSEYNNTYLAVVFNSGMGCDSYGTYTVQNEEHIGYSEDPIEQKVNISVGKESFFADSYFQTKDDKLHRILWRIGSTDADFVSTMQAGKVANFSYLDENWDIESDTFPLGGSRSAIKRAKAACWKALISLPEYLKH